MEFASNRISQVLVIPPASCSWQTTIIWRSSDIDVKRRGTGKWEPWPPGRGKLKPAPPHRFAVPVRDIAVETPEAGRTGGGSR